MRINDVDFYLESNQTFENLTIVTETLQTNSEWLFQYFMKFGEAVRLKTSKIGGQLPKGGECLLIKQTELPILSSFSTADEVYKAIEEVCKVYKHVVVFITIGQNLLDPHLQTGKELAKLCSLLLYNADLVLQLQPLQTGRARDITGRFVIAKGPKTLRSVNERELFYFVQKTVELREVR